MNFKYVARRETPITTVLTPDERIRVDAAGDGTYRALHRETFADAVRDLRENRAKACVVSVACCGMDDQPHVAMMVREFPSVPTVALLSSIDVGTPETVLWLGRTGVRQMVDARDPEGWERLRDMLLASQSEGIQRQALTTLALDLAGAPPDCWRFFEALFQSPPRVSSVRALAHGLGVLPSTMMSRFFRAQLPGPKRYLAMARLVRAAQLFENTGFSIMNVSNHLEYSSAQSFGRHIYTLLGVSASEFRRQYDGQEMLDRFRADLICPYLEQLRELRPLSTIAGWMKSSEGRE